MIKILGFVFRTYAHTDTEKTMILDLFVPAGNPTVRGTLLKKWSEVLTWSDFLVDPAVTTSILKIEYMRLLSPLEILENYARTFVTTFDVSDRPVPLNKTYTLAPSLFTDSGKIIPTNISQFGECAAEIVRLRNIIERQKKEIDEFAAL